MHERIVHAQTATGTVEGFTRDGVNRWRSIPYARPPVGPLRFRAPKPAQPWSGVRHCHGFANCAPQQRRYTMLGVGKYQPMSEDCLTLNVVTPQGASTESLPVMVFIHGGGYILGSSATPLYDGAALARGGCVYVSVNYRVGALGCLDLSSLSSKSGEGVVFDSNVYLRDLVMALRWVQDNIAEFGGDPSNVTVFGESAGAHITATLMAVPAAEGLFARAISESPAAGMVRSREVAAEFATRFAHLLGARTQDAANALMHASAAELVETQHRLIDQGLQNRLGAFPIGPVFGDDYLPLDPVEAIAVRCGAPSASHRRNKCRRRPVVHSFPQNVTDKRSDGRSTVGGYRTRCPRTYYRRIPKLSRAGSVHPARRRFRLQFGCLANRRGA